MEDNKVNTETHKPAPEVAFTAEVPSAQITLDLEDLNVNYKMHIFCQGRTEAHCADLLAWAIRQALPAVKQHMPQRPGQPYRDSSLG